MVKMKYANNADTMRVTRSLAMSAEPSGAMICIRGEAIGSMIALKSDKRIRVGRDPTVCDYIISDPKVSGKHFEITYIGALKQYRVVDYSRNGTFKKNGFRLQKDKEYYLPPAAELQFGDGNIYKLR